MEERWADRVFQVWVSDPFAAIAAETRGCRVATRDGRRGRGPDLAFRRVLKSQIRTKLRVRGCAHGRQIGGSRAVLATFELERFEWVAPDRLQLAGTLFGWDDDGPAAPALLVHGAERTHRLQAVDGDGGRPPEDGQPWVATFAWQDAPEAFHTAELELGQDISIELPEPRAGTRPFGGQRLEVRRAGGPEPDESGMNGSPPSGAERLRLQSELVSAQEEARELHARLDRADAELSRAREDLEAERERRAADAERFREALASVQGSA